MGGSSPSPGADQTPQKPLERIVTILKAGAGSKEPLSPGFSNFAGNCRSILRTNTAPQWPAFSRNANVADPAKLSFCCRA